MDSFEVNKIAGAILGTCLAVLTLNIAAGALFSPEKPAKPGFDIAATEPGGGAGAKPGAPPAPEEPIGNLLASATPEKGEQAAKKCLTCHTFTKGGPNRVGPNLYGIVGRPKASEAGFKYSDAMKAKGGNWTIEDLNHFLLSPKGYVPGTNMSFVGVPRGSERADLIVYMNQLSDNPQQLPPKAAEAPSSAPKTQ